MSVVVPVYNDVQKLSGCLAALMTQTYPRDRFEVIVVDNASTVDLGPAVPRDERVVLLHEGRRGSYAARNTGVASAKGEVLAFTDGDCTPRPDWLAEGVAALTQGSSPDAVGGAVELTFRTASGPKSAPEHFEAIEGFPQERYIEQGSFAVTANLFIDAHVFRQVGPFNADLMSGGDAEWCRRLGAAGGQLAYAARAVVEHPARSSWRDLTSKSLRVAKGMADQRAGSTRGTLLRAAVRDARLGIAVWRRVWRMPEPTRTTDKLRYAAAYCFVRMLRASVQVRRLSARAPRGSTKGYRSA